MFNILVVAKVVFLNEKSKLFYQLNEIIFTPEIRQYDSIKIFHRSPKIISHLISI